LDWKAGRLVSWRRALERKGMVSGRAGGWGIDGEESHLRRIKARVRGDDGQGGKRGRRCLSGGVEEVVHEGGDEDWKILNGGMEMI
jgi:hypothetical protein